MIHRSLTILSEVWDLFINKCCNCLFCTTIHIKDTIFCSEAKISIADVIYLYKIHTFYFLLWLHFSNLVQPVVFRRQVTRFEMKRGKHHMRRFGAVFDRRWQWGINLSIWGTTHKNTNNYFWRVFWYDTSNCEVCWKINPQLLKKNVGPV